MTASSRSHPRHRSSERRHRSAPAARSGPSLRDVLVFCALVALAATLFCWQYGHYQDWRHADRNPPAGRLVSLGYPSLAQFVSSFEVKHPALIREELRHSLPSSVRPIHFYSLSSSEGNYLMVELSLAPDRWIIALPVP